MTRPARDGRDGPFSDWLRRQPDLDSIRKHITANDIDMTLLKYRAVVDKIGTRMVKLMMDVEIKTHGALPTQDQMEVMCFRDHRKGGHFYYSWFTKSFVKLYYFGNYCLRIIGGNRPDDCRKMEWMQFRSRRTKDRQWRDGYGKISVQEITVETLVKLLGFEIAPDTFEPIELRVRRHHKTESLFIVDNSGLFENERQIVRRS